MQGAERDVPTTIFSIDWAVPVVSSLIRISAAVIIVEPQAGNKRCPNPNIKSSMLETKQLHVVSLLICHISTCLAFLWWLWQRPWLTRADSTSLLFSCLWSFGRLRQLFPFLVWLEHVGTKPSLSRQLSSLHQHQLHPAHCNQDASQPEKNSWTRTRTRTRICSAGSLQEFPHSTIPGRLSRLLWSNDVHDCTKAKRLSWQPTELIWEYHRNIFQIFEIVDQPPWHNQNQSESV